LQHVPHLTFQDENERTEVARDTTVTTDRKYPAVNVPRLCPFVLPVDVVLLRCNALRSEEGKALGSGHCYEEKREVYKGLY
jgi:hypothetical protein